MRIWIAILLSGISAVKEPTLDARSARQLIENFIATVASEPRNATGYFEPGAVVEIRSYEGRADVSDFVAAVAQCTAKLAKEISSRPGWNFDGARDFEVSWDCPSTQAHGAYELQINFFVRQRIVTGFGDYFPSRPDERDLPFRYGFGD